MNSQKYLIVNADDFGLSAGVNRGIIKAHEQGIVTSASLMIRSPAVAEAIAYARAHPELSMGLHVDLGEWVYLNETWHLAREVVRLDNVAAVAGEVARQVDDFCRLVGRNPTHLDSHQHVHRAEPAYSVLLGEARKLGVVLRDFNTEVQYCGEFYGQSNLGYRYPEGISVEALLRILRDLSPGTTELGCHPGDGVDWDSTYGTERSIECETLCDWRIRSAVHSEHIVLSSFENRRILVRF